jgi:hypothetical protein
MSEEKEKQENQKAENKKQSLNGTSENSAWEKAAEMIAGDNKLMSSLLKLLLSPFTLIAGAALIIYLFVKNKQHKDEITKLNEEKKKLAEEILIAMEETESLRKKYKKLKKVFEIEKSQTENHSLSEAKPNEMNIYNTNKNKVAYLR